MSFRVVNGSTHTEAGWRCCNRDECDIVRIPGLTLVDTAPLRRGAPLTILGAWLYWYDRNVEEITSPVWGWSATNDVLGGYGKNNGSNHLSAVAVDVNAPKYPWGKRVMPEARKAKIREGMALFSPTGRWQDSLIFWGADWNRADEMHYQLRFPEGDPRNDEFAAKLLGGYLGMYKAGPGPSGPAPSRAYVLARATGLPATRASQILPAVASGLAQSDCTTVPRIAMWLAQTGHESDGFNATEEYDDGPTSQERWLFKGRTWIQLTWRSAYEGFGKWCHARGLVTDPNVFVTSPRSLADLKWAGLGAAYYWTTTVRSSRKYPTLNQASDARDVLVATQIVNGGTNGLDDRVARYNRALAVGDALLTLISEPDPWEELLMANPVESWSIYATPGEPPIPPLDLLRAIDAKVHRDLTDDDARAGDPEAIRRVARTAAGLGKARTPGAIAHATRVLNEINAANPSYITAATPGRA